MGVAKALRGFLFWCPAVALAHHFLDHCSWQLPVEPIDPFLLVWKLDPWQDDAARFHLPHAARLLAKRNSQDSRTQKGVQGDPCDKKRTLEATRLFHLGICHGNDLLHLLPQLCDSQRQCPPSWAKMCDSWWATIVTGRPTPTFSPLETFGDRQCEMAEGRRHLKELRNGTPMLTNIGRWPHDPFEYYLVSLDHIRARDWPKRIPAAMFHSTIRPWEAAQFQDDQMIRWFPQWHGYGSIPIFIPFLGGYSHPFKIYQLFWCELQGYYWFWPIPTWIFLSGGSKHSTNADPKPPCWLFGAAWMQHDAAHDVVSMADAQ